MIDSPMDMILQYAMYFILNAIYEPSFLQTSHGLHSGKGTHSALRFIKLKFQDVKWCVEANCHSSSFTNTNEILFSLLKKRISCEKFLTLIKRCIKAGLVENGIFKESGKDFFQEDLMSLTLNNIYFHELDVFMNGLCENFFLGKPRNKWDFFKDIHYRADEKQQKIFCKGLWQVQSRKSRILESKKLFYVRYVDCFVIGIVGSKEDAVDIKKKVMLFLNENLKLTLTDKKSSIINFSKTSIFFLGTLIKCNKVRQANSVPKVKVVKKVNRTSSPVLKAPIKDLYLKAMLNGYFKKKSGKFIPIKIGRLVNFDHANILKHYNFIIKRIISFYSFVNNKKSLNCLVYGLKISCARTLALKYKLRFVSKVFSRFGDTLKCPDSKSELLIPKISGTTNKFAQNDIPIFNDFLFTRLR